MRAFYFILFQVFFVSFLKAQKEDNIWVLGGGYGPNTNPTHGLFTMQFKDSTKFKVYKEAVLDMNFSNSSVCDKAGNLLFCSNGEHLFDKQFNKMKGGENINIDSLTFLSNTTLSQGSLILPFPEHKGLYVFFYLPQLIKPAGIPGSHNVSYAIVDMDKNNSLGEVIQRKTVIPTDTIEPGKFTAVRHANGRDWWLIEQQLYKNTYCKLLLNPKGVKLYHKQTIGNDVTTTLGQAVFSPDGKYYINCDIDTEKPSPNITVFNFDRCTGLLSNPRTICYDDHSFWSGGAAVSSNSRYLYVSLYTKLYQYDLWADDLAASEKLIAIDDGYLHEDKYSTRFHAAQLAPNGKIYISCKGPVPFLHVINQPNLIGDSCKFVQRGQVLPKVNAFSVPNLPNYRLGALKGSPCDTLKSVATQDIDNQNIVQIFPNPTNDILNITVANNSPAILIIRDISGRVIESITFTAQTTISTANYFNGMIICEIWQDNQRISTERIVIQH